MPFSSRTIFDESKAAKPEQKQTWIEKAKKEKKENSGLLKTRTYSRFCLCVTQSAQLKHTPRVASA
jgi:hypothetical protein